MFAALILLAAFSMPCVAQQPACEAMGAVAPCEDGRAPVCTRRHDPYRPKETFPTLSAWCELDKGGKQSVFVYIYLPYLLLGALIGGVVGGVRYARSWRGSTRPFQ